MNQYKERIMPLLEGITGIHINNLSLENLSELKHIGHWADCAVTEEVTKCFVQWLTGNPELVTAVSERSMCANGYDVDLPEYNTIAEIKANDPINGNRLSSQQGFRILEDFEKMWRETDKYKFMVLQDIGEIREAFDALTKNKNFKYSYEILDFKPAHFETDRIYVLFLGKPIQFKNADFRGI